MTDVIEFGPGDPWRPPRRLIIAGLVVLMVMSVVLAVVIRSSQRRPIASPPAGAVSATSPSGASGEPGSNGLGGNGSGRNGRPGSTTDDNSCNEIGVEPLAPGALAALAIDGVVPAGGALERCDHAALTGPWTSIIRRPDGSLGQRSAVVTYPASPAPTGATASAGLTIWRVGGGWAQIRGDLSAAEIAKIVAGTTVVNGRPVLPAPGDLLLDSLEPYRPPAVHEIRYGAADVGEAAALGDGLVYTGVTTDGEFEDQLFGTGTYAHLLVNNQPAVVSAVFGGNGTLAWEPASGVVAYVGYSGGPMSADAVAALVRLANRTTPLTISGWQATRPASVSQTN
jgi:hypothetical protein